MNDYTTSDLNKVKRGAKRATYDKSTINNILDSGFIGFVSYTYQNKAITLPMAYARIEDAIYLHGSRKNRMLNALIEMGELSMTVMHLDGLVLARSGLHHSVNYRSVTIFGTTRIIEEPIKKTIALKAVINQMVPNRWESLRPMHEKELNGTLVVEVKINTASAKIRDVGVVDEKADLNLPIWAGVIPIKQIAELPVGDELLPGKVELPEHVIQYYERHKYYTT